MTLESGGSDLEAWRRRLVQPQGGVPIAMLHYVSRPPLRSRHRGLFISPGAFRQFVKTIGGNRAVTVPVLQAASPRSEASPALAITFDDGSADLITNALPSLSAHGFHGTAFIVANKIGHWNEWDTVNRDSLVRLADKAALTDWISGGQRIGSHGLTHRSLTSMSLAEARREIRASKAKLEDLFGLEITDFCYPYGDLNESICDEVRQAGYRTACSVIRGIASDEDDTFKLKRIPLEHRRPWLASIFPGTTSSWC